MNTHLKPRGMTVAVALATAAGVILAVGETADADVLAYYRFGDDAANSGFGEDSSGNGYDLTKGNAATQVSLPDSGSGSAFPDPIPQTDQANSLAMSSHAGGSKLAGVFASTVVAGDFTVEAFVNVSEFGSSTSIVVDQAHDSYSSGFTFEIQSGGNLFLGVGRGVVGLVGYNDGASLPALVTNNDYYIAASFDDETDQVVFYLQDLTAGGTLQSSAVDSPIADFTMTGNNKLALGSIANGAALYALTGLIDEVRISSGALSSSDLLIVPEPASLALLAMGGAMMVMRRRPA